MILADLEAQERKFVANSPLKKAEKTNFSWNLMPIKTVLLLPFFLKDPVYEREKCGYGAFIWKSDIALNEMIL